MVNLYVIGKPILNHNIFMGRCIGRPSGGKAGKAKKLFSGADG